MASHGSEHGIENTKFSVAEGVTLNDKQKTIVGCVLDVSITGISKCFTRLMSLNSSLPAGLP